MMPGIIRILSLLLVVACVAGCWRKKVPLDKDEFTALLIDVHRADGTLASAGGLSRLDETKNYAYYNDVFKKYNITKADFDSCMYYYSAQTALFAKMYDVVIDSLNRQLTVVDLVLNELRAKDSVNYFPVTDTIRFDTSQVFLAVQVDSIVPGQYKFSTTIRFDTVDIGKNNRIEAFFFSSDGKDTLRVNNVFVMGDTIRRTYNWSQYVDSTYHHLAIKFVDADNLNKLKKKRKGKAWDTNLFRPYISRETEQRLKNGLRREKLWIAK